MGGAAAVLERIGVDDEGRSRGIIAGRECPLCGGAGSPVGVREGVELRECRCVGRTLLAWAWADLAAYERWYAEGEYHEAEQERNGQRRPEERDTEFLAAARARLAYLQDWGPPVQDWGPAAGGTLLDVGCGAGACVAMAAAEGWHACGLEPGAGLADLARRLGRRVFRGGWEDAEGLWDVVTLHDVWEHLPRPVVALLHLRERLQPKGVLVVELPEWGCRAAEAQGVAWRHVRPRQHLFLPDDTAARALFARAGLRVLSAIRPRRGELGKISYLLQPERGP